MMTIDYDRAEKQYTIHGVPAEIVDDLKARLMERDISARFARYDSGDLQFRGRVNEHNVIAAVLEGVQTASARTEAAPKNADAPCRIAVKAGTVHVGDAVHGFVVTGLGRSFVPGEAFWSMNRRPADGSDVDGSSWQYAYFS